MIRELVICPICGTIVHQHEAIPIYSRASVPSRSTGNMSTLLAQMAIDAAAEHRRRVEVVERACVEHFRQQHRLRLALFRRFGWGWMMTRRLPWERLSLGEEFKFPVAP